MATRLEIFNLALTALGENVIDDVESPDTRATTLRTIYPHLIRTIIKERDWSFCVKHAELVQRKEPAAGAPDLDPPYAIPGFYRSFSLPDDARGSAATFFYSPANTLGVGSVDLEDLRTAIQLDYFKVERMVLYVGERTIGRYWIRYKPDPVETENAEAVFPASFVRYVSDKLAMDAARSINVDAALAQLLQARITGNGRAGNEGSYFTALQEEARTTPPLGGDGDYSIRPEIQEPLFSIVVVQQNSQNVFINFDGNVI